MITIHYYSAILSLQNEGTKSCSKINSMRFEDMPTFSVSACGSPFQGFPISRVHRLGLQQREESSESFV